MMNRCDNWPAEGSVMSGEDDVPRLCTRQPSSCKAHTRTWWARFASEDCPLSASAAASAILQQATTVSDAEMPTGQRSFAVFGPATWNSLPPSLRAPELSLNTFKRLLKTQLFQHTWTIVRRRCDWTVSSAPHTNIRTQLNSTQPAKFKKRQTKLQNKGEYGR